MTIDSFHTHSWRPAFEIEPLFELSRQFIFVLTRHMDGREASGESPARRERHQTHLIKSSGCDFYD